MTNVGTIPATEITFNLSATPSSVLANEASMCVTSTGLGTNGNDYVLYNGPLSGGLNANWGQNGDTLTLADDALHQHRGPDGQLHHQHLRRYYDDAVRQYVHGKRRHFERGNSREREYRCHWHTGAECGSDPPEWR